MGKKIDSKSLAIIFLGVALVFLAIAQIWNHVVGNTFTIWIIGTTLIVSIITIISGAMMK